MAGKQLLLEYNTECKKKRSVLEEGCIDDMDTSLVQDDDDVMAKEAGLIKPPTEP